MPPAIKRQTRLVPITLTDGSIRTLPAVWARRMPNERVRAVLLATDDGATITVEVDPLTWERCPTQTIDVEE